MSGAGSRCSHCRERAVDATSEAEGCPRVSKRAEEQLNRATSRAQVHGDPAATNRSAVPSVQLSQRRERRGRRSPGRRLPLRKDEALEVSVWRSLADGVLPEKGSFTATSILFYNPRVHHSPRAGQAPISASILDTRRTSSPPGSGSYSPPWLPGTRAAERPPRPAREPGRGSVSAQLPGSSDCAAIGPQSIETNQKISRRS